MIRNGAKAAAFLMRERTGGLWARLRGLVRQSVWPVVTCPGCQVPMEIRKVAVDAPGTASGTLIYVCTICGTQTARRHKGSELLSASEAEKL